jgi:hypothetical protein
MNAGTRQQRWADRETARRMTSYQQALAAWQADDDELTKMIAAAKRFEGAPDAGGSSVVLKRGERVFLYVPSAALVEVQRTPGQYTGGYSGFSFRITRGIRYNVGGSRGSYVQGAEQLKVTDQGAATITNQRVVFTGSRNSREWAFTKLVSVEHDNTRPVTMIGVSNRQKLSGLTYPPAFVAGFRFNLALAMERARDNGPGFVASLEAEQAAHRAIRPSEPTPSRPEEAPAGAATILGILRTVYTGKSSWKPRTRIVTGLTASLLTLAAASGIANSGGTGGQTSAADSSAVSQVSTPTPTPTVDASAAAARALARQQAHERHAAQRRRVAQRRRAQAREQARERRLQQQRAAARAKAKAEARARAAARARASAATATATAAQAPAAHACTTTSTGSCIRGGEFCPQASYGQFGYDADGTRYECTGDAVHPHWE